ncbi:SRPBCC domain-containing protein [Streptomyces sp. NBC_01565]|uniref:SRPBCC domain-containing protein n=1 Tax=unclassified Streptomyces TaxID=2593676 RepID=UPI00225C1366|nr:SRPBCC domain-containing protein [Streptomyces sp. NBC_01565]MCX4542330.1 SRPBCC domain-containing protein [Streptomyces sp. NBC_01565]
MEHQVFVPVPADSLRAVLRDPVRVARCVPGLQQDADADSGPLAGRLKVRVGGHTVTYRGALAVAERDPGVFAVDGEGTEIRGSGTVKLSLLLRLIPEGDGTRLDFTAGATADGRAASFAPEATVTAVRRLLDRAAEHLASAAAPADPVAEAEEAAAGTDTDTDTDADSGDGSEDVGEIIASVFETEVPPPSLDPFLEGEFDELGASPRPPAEAAHARRTMIGRSAEEVDHAPPRGRYAPVPAPASATAGQNLRWLAPAAALAVGSAILLGRALRRRR